MGLPVTTTILALLLMGTTYHRTVLQRKLIAVTRDTQRLEATLGVEQARNRELSQRLLEKDGEVVQLARRLEGETGLVERLTWHVAQLEGQLNALQGELALAIQQHRQRPAAQSRGTPQRLVELEKVTVSHGGPPVSGRVLEVNREWQFVVVDLGWDVLAIGDVLGVYRNGALIAKVGVERVQEQVAAATILPDYREAAVAIEDRVVPLAGSEAS